MDLGCPQDSGLLVVLNFTLESQQPAWIGLRVPYVGMLESVQSVSIASHIP